MKPESGYLTVTQEGGGRPTGAKRARAPTFLTAPAPTFLSEEVNISGFRGRHFRHPWRKFSLNLDLGGCMATRTSEFRPL